LNLSHRLAHPGNLVLNRRAAHVRGVNPQRSVWRTGARFSPHRVHLRPAVEAENQIKKHTRISGKGITTEKSARTNTLKCIATSLFALVWQTTHLPTHPNAGDIVNKRAPGCHSAQCSSAQLQLSPGKCAGLLLGPRR